MINGKIKKPEAGEPEWETVFTGYTGQVDMSHIGNGNYRVLSQTGWEYQVTVYDSQITVTTGTAWPSVAHVVYGYGEIRLYAAGGGFLNITKIQWRPI